MVQEQSWTQTGQKQPRTQTGQKLVMQNRERVELTGVTEVISFDNKEILLETVEGALQFTGENLHVKRLTLERGEVIVEGRVNSLAYHESQKDRTAGSFLGRLFR